MASVGEKPTMDEWVTALARDLVLQRGTPPKEAVSKALRLTDELVNNGCVPYRIDAEGDSAKVSA